MRINKKTHLRKDDMQDTHLQTKQAIRDPVYYILYYPSLI